MVDQDLLPAQTVLASLRNSRSLPPSPVQNKSQPMIESRGKIQIQGVSNLAYQLAKCCHPEVGDSIIGSITRLRGIVIHRETCSNVAYFRQKRPERLFTVEWE